MPVSVEKIENERDEGPAMAAHCAAANFRMLTTWVDTARMHPDHGTRGIDGRSRIGRAPAPATALFVEVCAGNIVLSHAVKQHTTCEVAAFWETDDGPVHDLIKRPSIATFLRVFESPYIVAVWRGSVRFYDVCEKRR